MNPYLALISRQKGGSVIPDEEESSLKRLFRPAIETAKTLITKPWGTAEAGLNLATQTYGLPAMGLAGIAGLPFGKSQEWAEKVGKATIYEPKTEAGKQITETVGLPFNLLGQASEKVADIIREKTGSPLLGAGAGTALQALPFLLGNRGFRQAGAKVLGSEGGYIEPFIPSKPRMGTVKPIREPKLSPQDFAYDAKKAYTEAKSKFEGTYGPDQTQWPGTDRNRLEVLRRVSEDAAEKTNPYLRNKND